MLRNIIYIGLFLIGSFNLVKATEVEVEINDVDINGGVLYLFVCDEESFDPTEDNKELELKCIASVSNKLTGEDSYSFVFNIPEGEYAFFGYIDEDFSGKLETNIIGIPKEAVIFLKKLKGKPHFKDIKSVIEGQKQKITLILQ